MRIVAITIFALELALLFVHEMDAIRRQEWKMFIILKDMEDDKAYHIFLLLHIPLYIVILLLVFFSFSQIAYYVVDAFVIAHMLIHLGFRKHPANKFDNTVSKTIINLAGILAVIHPIAALAE